MTTAIGSLISSSGHFSIGSVTVRFLQPLPVELAGLARIPAIADNGSRTPPIEIDLVAVDQRDWDVALHVGSTRYYKGRQTHVTEMDFAARRIRQRIVRPLNDLNQYWLLRDLFCCLGGLAGDVLFHGSSVIHRGRASVFCAKSGGGKSTLARLLAPVAEVVSDEVAWGTRSGPEAGWQQVNQGYWKLPPSAFAPTVPLRAVFALEQAPACEVRVATAAELFPLILTAPFGGRDPFLPVRAANTAALLRAVPVRLLRFNLDADAVRKTVFDDEACLL